MGDTLANMVYRHHGVIDFERVYREAKEFFTRRTDILEFIEKKHKQKDDEVEIVWVIKQNYDLYSQITYEIEYKLEQFKIVELTRADGHAVEAFDGKLKVLIKAEYDVNYGLQSVAGARKLFEDDSWLHKVYKTVTHRDRSDGVEDVAAITANEFLAVLKGVCGTDARE